MKRSLLSAVTCSVSCCVALVALPSTSAIAIDWPGQETAIVEAIESGNVERIVAAVQALEHMDPETALPHIQMALQSPNAAIREAAAHAAGASGTIDATPALLQVLSDRETAVRIAAVSAIADLRAPDVEEEVGRLLGDPEPEVREAAVESLRRLGSPDAVLAIMGVLHDTQREVVVAALGALGDLGQPSSVFAILDVVHDRDQEISLAAIDALIALRAQSAVPALMELARTGRLEVALAAVEGLGTLGAQEAASVLVTELVRPHVEGIREAAATALEACANAEIVPALIPILLADSALVIGVFRAVGAPSWPLLASTYAQIGAGSDAALPVLRAWLAAGDPDALRALAAHAEQGQLAADNDLVAELYASSPTPEGFCRATEYLGFPQDSTQLQSLVDGALAVGAVDCLHDILQGIDRIANADATDTAIALASHGEVNLAMPFLLEAVSAENLAWRDGVNIVSAGVVSGRPGRELLGRMLFHSDERLRREASFALADVDYDWLTPDEFTTIQRTSAGHPEVLKSLASTLLHGEMSAEVSAWLVQLASSGNFAQRAEAIRLSRMQCTLSNSGVVSALASTDLWVRRSAANYISACDVGIDLSGHATSVDPVLRAYAVSGDSAALAIIALDRSRSDDERVAALNQFDGEVATVEELLRDPRAAVAAAAWFSVARLDGLPSADVMALWAVASPHVVERAALYALLSDADDSVLDHARRIETADRARSALNVPDGGTAEPTWVFLVDGEDGFPRSDIPVFVAYADGTIEIRRTDAEGGALLEAGVVVLVPIED